MVIIAGIIPIKIKNGIYNLTAIFLPDIVRNERTSKDQLNRDSRLIFHLKNVYSPDEQKLVCCPVCGKMYKLISSRELQLICWNYVWFSVFCCYELTDIDIRAHFKSYLDFLIAVEWNKDINYFRNIIDSWSRDLNCYCVQVNNARYGDSCIVMPSPTEEKDIIRIKGGTNPYIVTAEIEIDKLRRHQEKNCIQQKGDDSGFKQVPPNFDSAITKMKSEHDVEEIKKKIKKQNS